MQDTADSVQDVWKDIAQRFPSDTATCPTSAPVEEDMADDFPMPPPSLSLEVKTAAATGGRWRRFRQRRSPAREPGAHGNVSFDVQQEQEIPSCNVGHRILRKMGWTAGSGLGNEPFVGSVMRLGLICCYGTQATPPAVWLPPSLSPCVPAGQESASDRIQGTQFVRPSVRTPPSPLKPDQ